MDGNDHPEDSQTQPQNKPARVSPIASDDSAVLSKKEAETTDDSEKCSQGFRRETRTIEILQLVANVSLAVIGIFALCIYGGQLNTMRDASQTAQNTLLLDQRAWVGVQGTQNQSFNITKGFTPTIVFLNSGKTPAHNVRTSAGYMTSPVPASGPSPEQIAALEFRPAQSIAPQSKYNMALGRMVMGEGQTPHQMEGNNNLLAQLPDIQKGNLVMYYFGVVQYDDIFNKSHQTQFCVYLADPKTGGMGVCDAFNDLN